MLKDEVFLNFEKPGRYIGREWNSITKDQKEKIKFLLAYPDLYEIGMSSLAIILLYHLINNRNDTLCERVFSVGKDLENFLRKENIPLFSIESKSFVKDFHILGFSLQSQLDLTNVLNMLSLSKIDLFSKNRNNLPLIIAGGPVCLNPMPISPFIDAFVIGEGEEVIHEIIDSFSSNKEAFLKNLNKVEGVFIPKFGKKRVKKRVVKNFEEAFLPLKPIVPYIQIIHDRATVEIFRGCDRGCRFCISGYEKRPRRERSIKKITQSAFEILKNTGYEELSLLSLSTSDYSNILELIKILKENLREKKITISLPSLRIDNFSVELLDLIDTGRKATLTFAPEGGTEKIRNIMNKPIKDEVIFTTINKAVNKGYKKIKLYFLIGVPYENEDDIYGIVDLVSRIKKENSGIKLSLSINPFIPKPFTPFQWEKFIKKDEYLRKVKILKKELSYVNLRFRGWEQSFIEAIISRGDETISDLIYKAYLNGQIFTNWSEFFDYSKWDEIIKEGNYKIIEKIVDGFDEEEELPWDFIDIGIKKEFLITEREKAKRGIVTEPCFMDFEKCSNCGVCFNL